MILAIDPGTTRSAYVLFSLGSVVGHGDLGNQALLTQIYAWGERRKESTWNGPVPPSFLAIEMIASYGMSVGAEVFETCTWIGRFIEAWNGRFTKIYRRDIKLSLCGDSRAKDGNIRQRLIDLYGPGKEKAIGIKKKPGPLYGISGDEWAALAVAVYVQQQQERRPNG